MKTRNDQIDIARGTLILLVVWGHLLEMKGFNGSLYFAIYTFHIPALAMISGMYSKSRLDAKQVFRICRQLLLPSLVFQVLYFYALGYLAPERVSSIFIPAWIIWFLFSLTAWKILLPLVLRLPYPFLLSFLAALMVGFSDTIGREFSLSRTFVFFPAFLFGHLYGKRTLEAVTRYRIPFSVLFVAIFCAAYLISDRVDIQWLWGAQSYSRMPLDTPGIVYRIVTVAIGIISSVAFLAVVPSRAKSLAYLGQNTLQVYLLHGFLVILFWNSGIQFENSFWLLAFTASLSLVISFSIAWISNLLPMRSAE